MAAPFAGTPVADDATITTTTDTPVDFQLTGTCAGTMHFTIVTAPAEGTFGNFDEDTGEGQYVPAPGFEGTEAFTFTVDDGSDVSTEATVTVEVMAATAGGTPSSAPPPASTPPAPPSTIPPPPATPTGTSGSGTMPGMGPAAAGAAVGAAAATAAGTAGGATPAPAPAAPPAPPAPVAPVAPAPGAPVVPPAPPAPGAPIVPPAPGAPAVPAPGAPIVPPPPPPPAPAPAPAKTPWYRDWRWLALIAALAVLTLLLIAAALKGCDDGGGAPGPVQPPPPPTTTSTTPPTPPPPVVSGVSCPNGYIKVPLAANSCQLLGWDGERMPYQAVSSPQAGRLVVGNAPLPHQNVVSGMTDIAGEDLAICWPSAIPFGSKVAANTVMQAVYGQHANHVVQPGWYSANCDWQTRCGLRLDDPACVSYNADGSADFTKCNLVIPVPIP